MVAYNFQKRFSHLVEYGQKRQTIRPERKRHAKTGEFLQLYTGMRSKHCRKLVTPDPVCLGVTKILLHTFSLYSHEGEIRREGYGIYYNFADLGTKILTEAEIEKLAIADGFGSSQEFFEFFVTHYGLPFSGVIVKW